ncbi:MAG: amidohydrolase family protein [Proteobacteria bacterium]|nr:amidohydrolase family protein [Pseudomonadota bacterium]
MEVEISGERISRVISVHETPRGRFLGGKDFFLAPGFIDIQVNGFAGIDFNHPAFDGDDLLLACKALLRTGVTRFCPTLITGSRERLSRSIGQILKACAKHPLVRSMVLGIHIEGPYIAAENGPRGAHSKVYVSDPDWDEFLALCELSNGLLRIVTIAPERPGALEFIGRASKAGLVVAIGHCAPETEDIDAAVEAGAALSTHLGNAAHKMLPRHANYIQKQISHDGLMASIICDGNHLPDYFVQNLIRAKGKNRIILVTDAMAAAAAPIGRYTLGDLEVVVGEERVVRLPGTLYLAGSALTLDEAVSNCARFARISLASAIKMVTVNPAKLFDEIGGVLEPDERADLVLFRVSNQRIQIEQVFLAGQLVFSTN